MKREARKSNVRHCVVSNSIDKFAKSIKLSESIAQLFAIIQGNVP